MDTNSNNKQLHEFSKGMVTDISDLSIQSGQYRLANNLRYVTDTDENTGELRIIEGALKSFSGEEGWNVLGSTQIRQYGIIVVEKDDKWAVFKFENPYWDDDIDNRNHEPVECTKVFGWCSDMLNTDGKISMVTRFEDNDNIKLYIADGKHSIITINIAKEYPEDTDINMVTAYPSVLFKKPIFCGLINGTLPSGLVEYSYQLYNKYGNFSEISPSTKLIPLHTGNTEFDGLRTVSGFEQGVNTDKGVKIKIDLSDVKNFDSVIVYRIMYTENGQMPVIEKIIDQKIKEKEIFVNDGGLNGLSLLSVEEYNSMTGIHIIPETIESKDDYMFAANIKTDNYLETDEDIFNWDARAFRFDINKKCLVQSITADTQEYFNVDISGDYGKIGSYGKEDSLKHDAYNIYNDMSKDYKEGSSYQFTSDAEYYGGSGVNVSWKFIVAEITGDASRIGNNDYYFGRHGSKAEGIIISDNAEFTNKVPVAYVKSDGTLVGHHMVDASDFFDTHVKNSSYANPSVSYYLKSLRRNELYRYGIILYDDKGNSSAVKWIADIRTPNANWKGFNIFISHGQVPGQPGVYEDLVVRPLGIEFEVSNLPETVVAYEIVRCGRTSNDIATVSQGVLARPIKRINPENDPRISGTLPLTPTGWMSINRYWTGLYTDVDYDDDDISFGWQAYNNKFKARSVPSDVRSNILNNGTFDIYQFVSPEVCYTSDSTKELLERSGLSINPVYYLFGTSYDTNASWRNKGASGYPNYDVSASLWFGPQGFSRWMHPGNKWTHIPAAVNDFGNLHAGMRLSETTAGYYCDVDFKSNARPVGNNFSTYYQSRKNRYQYIKLYESSNNVLVNGYNDYMNESNVKLKDVSEYKYEILQIAFPESMKWNEFAGSSKPENGIWPLTYTDKITSIGNRNFNNWVSGGGYGIPMEKNEALEEGSIYMTNEDALKNTESMIGHMFGPGGKCILLNLDVKKGKNDYPEYEMQDIIATGNAYECSNSSLSNIEEQKLTVVPDTSSVDYVNNTLVYRESALGTLLCNLRQNVIPYGGNTASIRATSNYFSYGDYFEKDSSRASVFDGDCYIQPMEYVSLHKWYHPSIENGRNTCILYAIPVETNINLAYTYGFEFSKQERRYDGDVSNLQVEATNVYNRLMQDKDLYVYNSVYSTNNYVKYNAAQGLEQDLYVNNNDYRTYFSNKKDNNELLDNWTKFMPANYLDVDTRYGGITGLRRFHNTLVFWQEDATGLFSVNERSAITDDSNLPLILGTGGVLTRYDYINTSNGMHQHQYCDAQSDSTLYWWDHNKHELCAFAGGQDVAILSKVKFVQNLLNKAFVQDKIDQNPKLSFDKRYNELIASVTNLDDKEHGSLVYSETQQAFSSIYSINPKHSVNFPDCLYFVKDNGDIYEWDILENGEVKGIEGEPLLPYLKYVVNDSGIYTKVFDNAEFGGRIYGGSKDQLEHLTLKFSTPLKQKSYLNGKFIENREYNFRYIIPRAVDENGKKPLYGDRLRGKTMQCELESDSNSYDFSLQFIINKYRISWS